MLQKDFQGYLDSSIFQFKRNTNTFLDNYKELDIVFSIWRLADQWQSESMCLSWDRIVDSTPNSYEEYMKAKEKRQGFYVTFI